MSITLKIRIYVKNEKFQWLNILHIYFIVINQSLVFRHERFKYTISSFKKDWSLGLGGIISRISKQVRQIKILHHLVRYDHSQPTHTNGQWNLPNHFTLVVDVTQKQTNMRLISFHEKLWFKQQSKNTNLLFGWVCPLKEPMWRLIDGLGKVKRVASFYLVNFDNFVLNYFTWRCRCPN